MFELAASFELTHTAEEQRLVAAAKQEIRDRDFPRLLLDRPEQDPEQEVAISWRGLAIAVAALALSALMVALTALVVLHG